MELAIIQNRSDLKANAGKTVTVSGRYGIQDLSGYSLKVRTGEGGWKRIRKIAFIRLKDGCFVNLGHRPVDEMRSLNGRCVTAVGKLLIIYEAPVKLVMAKPDSGPDLVEIKSIQLQPGNDRALKPEIC